MAQFDNHPLPYFGTSDRSLEAMQMATPAMTPTMMTFPGVIHPHLQASPITQATPLSAPPNPLRSSTPLPTPSPAPLSSSPLPPSLPPKPKKPWTEAERTALKDAVIKYRTRKNQHKLPWKQILSDPLYYHYRVERSKDAIMQHWKTLKKEVNMLPAPEPVEEEADASDSTDSDSSASSRRSSLLPVPAAKPRSAAKVKWTDEDTAVLDEAMARYGQDWRKILADDSFRQRLKNRNPVSLGKNFHRFHPRGVAQKAAALEEKRRRKEAKEEKAALEELSATSDDDDSDSDASPPPRPSNGSHSKGGDKVANASAFGSTKRRREAEHSASEDSESDSSSASDGSTDDDDDSGATSTVGGADAPIQSWEKPDSRDVNNFRRCRHVCGCKSLTSEGREFVNQQAVMVRGSRRNHEVNQNLHPHCRNQHKSCERLLGPLKDATGKSGKRRRRTAEDEEMDEEHDEEDDDPSMDVDVDDPLDLKRRGKRLHGNGEHAGGNGVKKEEASHRPPLLAPLSTYEAPSGGTGGGGRGDVASVVRSVVEKTTAKIGELNSALREEIIALVTSSLPAPLIAPSPSTVHSYAERYEKLLERTGQQDEEIRRLKETVAALEQRLEQHEPGAPETSAGPTVKTEAMAESASST